MHGREFNLSESGCRPGAEGHPSPGGRSLAAGARGSPSAVVRGIPRRQGVPRVVLNRQPGEQL